MNFAPIFMVEILLTKEHAVYILGSVDLSVIIQKTFLNIFFKQLRDFNFSLLVAKLLYNPK